MKIIDLLNKIANGEEIPKKIKYKDYIYEYYETSTSIDYRWYDEKTELHGYLSSYIDYNSFKCLNDEIEIIEENKEIEQLRTWYSVETKQSGADNIEYANTNFEMFYEKIRELVDKVNELDKR